MKKIFVVTICFLSFILTFSSMFQTPVNQPESKKVKHERRGSRSGAMEALDFWSSARAYPGVDVDKEKYFKEYQREKIQFKRNKRGVNAAGIWEPIGPFDLQGRSLSVAVNPQNSNTIYVGSASGGMWRSYTQGADHDWLQVPLGYPALGISSIIIDPADTNIMYVGTGEVYRYQGSTGGHTIRTTRGSYGIGILKSLDGGQTWTKSLDWSNNQQSGIQKLLMNPQNGNTIWAATTEGLYVSYDEGATWNPVYPVTLVNDIVINNNDTNKILISVGNFKTAGYGVYKSTNGGGSFNAVSGIPDFSGKTALSLYESDPNIVYASVADSTTGVGSLWKTTNFGDTWTELPTSVYWGVQGWYSHFIAVHPTNPDLLCHASVGIVYSDDGGASFLGTSGGYSDNHGFAYDPNNPDVLYAANDDGIYRSTDFGKTFQDVGFGMMTGQFYAGFSCSAQDSNIAIGQSQDHIPGYIYRGTLHWDGSVVDEAGWTAIHPTNDYIMYADSRYGDGIYKSTNRGNSFTYITGLSGFGSWNAPLALSKSNPVVLYFAKDKVYKSINSGLNWAATNSNTVLDGNPAISMAIAPTSHDTVFVGNAPISSRARVWRTTNQGNVWTDVTGTLPDRYPLDIAIDPTDSRIVYVVFGGFGTGKVYKSTDAGGSWTDITGTLPDVPTTAVVIDPENPNYVYVGNDISVYLSTNGGTSWSTFGDGLPDAVIVADLVISPSNRALRCVTHGNGVHERKLYDGTTPAAFDYKAFALVYPSTNANLIIGSTLKGIKATFRSNSGENQTDSFDVQYRVLNNFTEKFSTVKRVKGMKVGEFRLVEFDDSYIPADTGMYEVQAISLASDLNSSNDTLKGSLEVTSSPTISFFNYSKVYEPYTEIVGGTAGPKGDDAQKAFGLPFQFMYDGFWYDSLQISTNGWVEFGSGTPGSIRGLSSSGQLGFYYVSNTYLGTTDRPTKLIAPWWDDSHSGEPGAGNNITYTTLGSSPNRIVVVQWKNIRAHYENDITTFLNYQVRLYETSNQIDVCYGPVTLGVFYGGAAMGVKDHRGGDYHFYDLYQMKTGTGVEAATTLNPYDNWPGEDSCFRIIQNAVSVQVQLNKSWNLVSMPVNRANNIALSVFPSANPGSTFGFVMPSGYIGRDTLIPGYGYWTKFPSAINMILVGNERSTVDIKLNKGWNVIGSVDHEIPVPTDTIFATNFLEYDTGYIISSTLKPGKGYWVRTNDTGTVTLGGVHKTSTNVITAIDKLASISISDNSSLTQKLYIAGTEQRELSLERFEMPPLPPAGVFDARFASNRMLEKIENGKESIFPITLTSASYPLTFSFNPSSENLQVSLIVDGREIPLHNGAKVQIARQGRGSPEAANSTSRISLKVTAGDSELPNTFSLEQNYPNPFNPSTVIRYQLPVNSHVTLKVYDLLGREVATLVDGMQDAGFKMQEWNAGGFASGVYLYQLKAGSYTEVKKLVLMK
ncbi:MAG: T9SS type A sorting domain-containing protein [Bacteroidetes bacterium]|nr:MAG: T9SS type A sorting domain-containing protein [Bacteroidota bacterium]